MEKIVREGWVGENDVSGLSGPGLISQFQLYWQLGVVAMPALTVKLRPSCRQAAAPLPSWLSHITDTELSSAPSSQQSPVLRFYFVEQPGPAPPPTLNIYLLMFREKQSGKMETPSSCQQILLIAKFPDLRTTNIEPVVESAKRTEKCFSISSTGRA